MCGFHMVKRYLGYRKNGVTVQMVLNGETLKESLIDVNLNGHDE